MGFQIIKSKAGWWRIGGSLVKIKTGGKGGVQLVVVGGAEPVKGLPIDASEAMVDRFLKQTETAVPRPG